VAPAPDAAVALGEPTEIWGWAWSFRGIAVAEISVDGGASYVRATLGARRGWTWQRFSLPWRPADRGETRLCVRALEDGGAGQPREGARNAIHTVRVVVQ
jgi:sulfane dehydrogenase subunit SoxC